MRKSLAVFFMTVALFVLAQPTPKFSAESNKTEDELVNLFQNWLQAEARGDKAALNNLVAEDFIGTAFGGNIVTKDDVVPPEGTIKPWNANSSLKNSTARAFGDAGVVMGRVAVPDLSQPGEFRFTIVCMKRQAGWQIVAAHLSRDPRTN